ncbi:MAG: COG4315 family predicted lipoprotein [Nitrososphaerales archaeon]
MRRKMIVQGIMLGLVAAVCAGSALAATTHAASKKAGSVAITTRKDGKLGTILVNSKGYTLYMFVPDKDKKVTCFSSCAAIWPPVFLSAGEKAVASGNAESKLLGSDPDSAGGRVVTYAGWPLYTYIADTKPGMVSGQAINLNGGLWYVLSASGKVIKTKAEVS